MRIRTASKTILEDALPRPGTDSAAKAISGVIPDRIPENSERKTVSQINREEKIIPSETAETVPGQGGTGELIQARPNLKPPEQVEAHLEHLFRRRFSDQRLDLLEKGVESRIIVRASRPKAR